MQTQVILRIDSTLKAQMSRLAKAEGKNTSQILRELAEEYIQSRDIGLYIDSLWGRLGKKMKQRGFNPQKIKRIIKEIRNKK